MLVLVAVVVVFLDEEESRSDLKGIMSGSEHVGLIQTNPSRTDQLESLRIGPTQWKRSSNHVRSASSIAGVRVYVDTFIAYVDIQIYNRLFEKPSHDQTMTKFQFTSTRTACPKSCYQPSLKTLNR